MRQQHKRHEGDSMTLPQGSRCDNKTTGQRTGLASGSVDSGAGGSGTENKLSADSILCLTRKQK